MNSNEEVSIVVKHRYRASADRVFDAWFDTEKVGEWLFATPTGKIVRAEFDVRVGGLWIVTDRRDGEDVDHQGEYLEVDRPRRLVFTFRVEKYSKVPARVEIDILPMDEGCELTLTQYFPAELAEWADKTVEGWTMILGNLGKALGEGL